MNDGEEKVFPKPVDWDELYPGRFVKAGDFKGQKVTSKISEVDLKELVGDKGAMIKGVVSFENRDKKWALNKTNGFCLRQMFGRKVQDWRGKRVTLFASKIENDRFKGEDCIRVWGSPDIAADMEVTITMPRKRPVVMTMHKVVKGTPAQSTQQPSTATSQDAGSTSTAPTTADALAKVREAKTFDALTEARKTVWGLYAAASVEVPMEVEIAATDRRLALEGE